MLLQIDEGKCFQNNYLLVLNISSFQKKFTSYLRTKLSIIFISIYFIRALKMVFLNTGDLDYNFSTIMNIRSYFSSLATAKLLSSTRFS